MSNQEIKLTVQPSETTAKVLLDSEHPNYGPTLTTVECTFARSALAELNTHRAFSRNSASSRAIPVAKMLAQVQENPFIPRRFSMSQKGMSASEFVDYAVDPSAWQDVAEWWLKSRDKAIESAQEGLDYGLHKQDVNRILEPFMMHTAIISSTEWDNFFQLRLAQDDKGNPLAYPPIFDLAMAIMVAISDSEPTIPEDGWHTPLIGFDGDEAFNLKDKLKVSAARVGRVSYLTHEGIRDVEADIKLFGSLSTNGHFSPLEHVAQVGGPEERTSNFTGWTQLRRLVEHKMF
jgi:thymidylate synthase ThyX